MSQQDKIWSRQPSMQTRRARSAKMLMSFRHSATGAMACCMTIA
jgi:hypothetical protein